MKRAVALGRAARRAGAGRPRCGPRCPSPAQGGSPSSEHTLPAIRPLFDRRRSHAIPARPLRRGHGGPVVAGRGGRGAGGAQDGGLQPLLRARHHDRGEPRESVHPAVSCTALCALPWALPWALHLALPPCAALLPCAALRPPRATQQGIPICPLQPRRAAHPAGPPVLTPARPSPLVAAARRARARQGQSGHRAAGGPRLREAQKDAGEQGEIAAGAARGKRAGRRVLPACTFDTAGLTPFLFHLALLPALPRRMR